MDYLDAARLVGTWLLTTADRQETGWTWPVRPTVSPEFDMGMWGGMPGPVLFFVEAYRTTGDDRWLEPAHEGARWMRAHADGAIAGEAGCGLFTGVGGWVLVLDELARATGDGQAERQADDLLVRVMDAAEPGDTGVHWHGLNEILWGTAGIGCLLLSEAAERSGDRAPGLAVQAGDWLLARAEEAPRGIRWGLGPNYEAEYPEHAHRRYPNFAHGTAGIAFFLARLAERSGEERFLEAARSGLEWVFTTVRTEDDTCAAYHDAPDNLEMFTLGWCHGPPGLAWTFRQLELSTGEPEWRSWIRRAARADRLSGIPVPREPGFWDNVARCCGSAGVAEFFLDLHRLDGHDDDLGFARTMVDDLIGRAMVDGSGMRWSNVEHTAADPALPPETTYMQGASGIGSTLLRMHRHLAGDDWVVRWPHAPLWDPGLPPDERSATGAGAV